MMYKTSSLADFMYNSKNALVNARNEQKIYPLLAGYNMTTEKIDKGLSMLDALMTADRKKTELHGLQLMARAEFKRVFLEVNREYLEHVNFTKLQCRKDPVKLEKLLLLEPRTRVINGWLRQADTFYSNLLDDPELIGRLADTAITVERLREGYANVQRVLQARSKYTEIIGMAQDATEKRNILLEEFNFWMKEFIYICKVALKDHPQLLESLGIQVLSAGYTRQKAYFKSS
ncbi:MAG: hypothetical protein NT166_26460 [Candidatus Aminicenantes bacterium]|nr:hypothetical protein [Candidatus Aminicenantes bacterium]